jgi:hypothetical protein
MSRIFSVPRRRPGIVDLYANFVYGVDLYRVWAAANFDTTPPWTKLIECTNIGFFDSNVSRDKIESQPTAGKSVRIVFNPQTFSLTDEIPIWLQVSQLVGMVETFSPPTLLLPESMHHGVGIVTLSGSAPSGTTVTDSLQLDLPRLMSDFRFSNEDGTAGKLLYVATVPGGPEFAVNPSADVGATQLSLRATEGTLLVRGDGAAVNFTATCSMSFPK